MDEGERLLTIDCERTERHGTAVVTAKLGDEVVEMDKLDLTQQTAREKFVKTVSKALEEVRQTNRPLDLSTWPVRGGRTGR